MHRAIHISILALLAAGAICLSSAPWAFAQDSSPPIEKWVSDLGTGDTGTRREAAYQLHQLGGAALPALPALIKALDDGDQQVWFHSIMAIAAIGPDAAPATSELIQGRRGGDQASYRTAYALGRIGAAALPALQETFKRGRNHEVAARALGFMGSAAAPAIPDLIGLLESNDSELRGIVVETLGVIGPEAVEPLRQALLIEDREARASSALALGEIGAPALQAADQLADLARHDPAALVRVSAIQALRRMQYPQLLPILLDAFQAPGTEDQDAAINALLLLRPADQTTVPALIPLLRSEETNIRERAAYVLGKVGPPAAAAVPGLIEQIELSPTETEPFVRSLAGIGPIAAPALLNKLGSVDWDALSSHWSFVSLKEMKTRALPSLAETLSDSNPKMRLAALLLAVELGPRAAELGSSVLRLVEDPEPAVRSQAIHTALALEAPLQPARTQLIGLLKDPIPQVRGAAALALSNLGDHAKGAEHSLLELAEDPDLDVAVLAIQALGSVPVGDKPEAAKRLVPKLDGPHAALRRATIQTLGKLGPGAELAVANLAPIAKQSSKELRLAAVEALGRIASQDVRPTLELLIQDTDPDVRAKATLALGQVQDPTALPLLIQALSDDESNVRMNAAESIGLLGNKARDATEALFEMLKGKREWEAALEATRAIEVVSVSHLIDILAHDEPAVRGYACERLRALGPAAKEALPALRPLLDDRYEFIKNQARRAIRSIERD